MRPSSYSPRRIFQFVALLLLAVSVGCATPLQSSPPTNLYTLEYETPNFPELSPLQTSLRLSAFGAAPEYQTANIAYREREFTRGYYPYQKWLTSPPELVAYFLERDLTKANLFSSVLSSSSRLQPTYTLDGTVEDFLESDEQDGWVAQLSLNILLQRMSKGKMAAATLMQRTYSARARCAKRSPQAVAAAMSEAMGEISGRILRDAYMAVAADLQEQQGKN